MNEIWEDLRRRMDPLPEGRALVGFSGGADSAALLTLLLPLRDGGKLFPEAVHVNHGLRGAEAEADAEAAERFCREREIPFHLYRLSLGERRDENAAREGRYACFRACAEETGIRRIILAHQMEDQAETFLMRLVRGAGPEGLGCMRPREEREGYTLLRPLLRISGRELRGALEESGIPWREDRSNAEDLYLRNRIRHRLLPEMESLAPGAAERIARTAGLIGECADAARLRAGKVLDSCGGDGYLLCEGLSGLEEAEKALVMRLWWRREGPQLAERNPDFQQTRSLVTLAEAAPGTVVNLPGGYRAERGRQALHLIPPEREMLSAVPYDAAGCALGSVELRTEPSRGNPGDGRWAQEVPPGFPEGCEIRTRRPGDYIRPFGMEGRRSLQDYLTDRKIDAPWRDRLPLLCRGREVLLAAGVGAGHIPAWKSDEEHIRLVWDGRMPWAGEGKKR